MIETPAQSAQAFSPTFSKMIITLPRTAPTQRRAKGRYMRIKQAALVRKPRHPCPVCGAETALMEIEPHPLNVKFEIHGYLCEVYGPIKSLVVLHAPPLQSMM
jgi:hypothetical protein